VAKFCVFCGAPPEDKNREHILPYWLLELTGDPHRRVPLALNFDTNPNVPAQRSFAFSHFTFPACSACNTAFGALEGAARSIVQRLLSDRPVGDRDIATLLDWLDKVRVGLWLGQQQLNGSFWNIRPNFYIADRVARTDRAVFISKIAGGEGLTVVGVQTPQFMFMPTVFGLRINDLLLFNASTDYLLSHRMGFPYPVRREATSNSNAMVVHLRAGKERVRTPLLPHRYPLRAVKFFQPIFAVHSELEHLYDTDYVRERSANWERGIGHVFKQNGEDVARFGEVMASDYEAMGVYDTPNLKNVFNLAVLDWQNWMSRFLPSNRKLPRDEARARSEKMRLAAAFNKDLIRRETRLRVKKR
jgi:hypothetical protein